MRLRSICHSDIEFLRKLKNSHNKCFFNQDIISEENQRIWFKNYSKNKHDIMFVLEEKIDDIFISIACMGFRYQIKENNIDLYNIIRGPKRSSSNAKVSYGLNMMIEYIEKNYFCDITAKVLIDNPAIKWYLKNKFHITERNSRFYKISYIAN